MAQLLMIPLKMNKLLTLKTEIRLIILAKTFVSGVMNMAIGQANVVNKMTNVYFVGN